ncbi:LysR family transcriptional regulator [Ruminococcus bromii]|uniref:LysR family transcriptional regulator n=1 Tax=Ruminococcus bromii TaxID=40518 RepID=UPI00095A67A8|nr:LysR family transcriptional regulator [Oscillospiraceae bacterium]OLA51200.1 MAG: transcriptional regulator [Ruminococcus sp. CAG:108-related_41_35]
MNRYIALQKIIELGGFTKAADALGYTQSSISQMIASLENELGIKLLTRSRHGVKLTIEGAELFPFIERSIYQYRSMQEKANEIKGIETGIIRVGIISSVTCHWMPQLINGFKEEYPNVQFLFHQGDYTLIPEWIASGQIDFGFVNPLAGTNLKTKTVKSGEMLAVLPKNHPLAKKKSIQLQDIAAEPYILLEEGHYSEPMAAFEAAGIQPNIQYTIHDDYAIMMMVEAGLGVSILAELILRRTNYDIVCLPIDPPITRTLAVGYKDKDSLPIASKYFIDYLMEHKDELP